VEQSSQTEIGCSIIRGGTSRGAYFLADDIPAEVELRNNVLLGVMGGPDALQIDGLGGGHPLTSKIAIVGLSDRDDADIDYLFLQVSPREQRVSTTQNCGNILAGVGPFAIDHGLVQAQSELTRVRVHMVNTGNLCELTVQTPNGVVQYDGDESIDGVPGTAAPVVCDFLDVAGSVTGALLPTGNIVDIVDDTEVTCVDNGMPVVLLRATDLGCSGSESPEELDNNEELKSRLERIRLALGPKMNLDDVAEKTVPKMCLIAAATDATHISTRTFIPHVCHRSIGVLGAVSVATACLFKGSVADGMARLPDGDEKSIDVGHPSGSFRVRLLVNEDGPPEQRVRRAGVIRTARTLMRGKVFIPRKIWAPEQE